MPKTKITRSGTGFSVPSTFMVGYNYARMGYTTVMTPAMPPLMARHTHEELNDTPIIDKSAYTLFDGSWFAMNYLRNGDINKCAAFAAWLLRATKGYAIKVVNPGGTELWGWGRNVTSLEDEVPYFGVTPREIIRGLVEVNELLGLPHSVHLHPNNLGKPGNYQTTLKTFDVPNGIKSNGRQVLHVTHVQFHSYGGDSWKTFESEAEKIAKYSNKNGNIALDVGFITLDETTTMTADGPMEYYLHNLTHLKWINRNIELETAPGVTPFVYSRKNPVHSVQWAVGLELALMVEDPMKILLSTDHPNGGPFTRYPRLIAWLMSRKYRKQTMERLHSNFRERSMLEGIDREYDFYEIAKITRAGQAKVLGLSEFKGHLGEGADADIAVYDIDSRKVDASNDYKEIEKKFSRALYTIKDGEVVVKDGEVVATPRGRTFWVNAEVDEALDKEVMKDIDYYFKRYYSVNLANYPVQDEYLPRPVEIKVDATHIK
jgi:formylmethanofuran dehydrogenase subunit A